MPLADQSQQLDSLLPTQLASGRASRRSALKLALGASYAAAALPALAQTAIHTPADGLDVGESSVDVAGFSVPLYYARPSGKTGLPVVLVVHEIFGVHAYIADTCRRLARAGYLAIAPELYARQGDPGSYGEMAKLMREVVAKVGDAQVLRDLDACVGWAADHGGNRKKLAITGFCWGGRITWLYSQYNPALKAAVAWYGRLVGTPSSETPRHPLQGAMDQKAPVLGLYGGEDAGIPVSTINQMKEALVHAAERGNHAAAGCEFVLYRDAPHAFHADYRPSYRVAAAQDGWARALAWFKAHGVE